MTFSPPPVAHVTQQNARQPRALALFALALGLTSLLTLVIAALYARPGLLVSAFLGVVAGGLGVAALVLKHRPLGAAIGGLTAGVAAVLVSMVLMVATVVSPLISADQPSSYSSDQNSGNGAAGELLTPNHMGSGGALFSSGMVPVEGAPMDVSTGPIAPEIDRADGPIDIVVYVDYRCPHCLSFEEVNGATLQEVAATGQAVVEIRPLTFMDRYSQGSEYSSRAANFFACTVDTQPEDAWLAHSMLLSTAVQPRGEGPGLTNEELLTVGEIAFPISDDLRSCVMSEAYVPFAQFVTEWTFGNPALGANDASLSIGGTPTVLIGGDLYEGSPDDAAGFRAALVERGILNPLSANSSTTRS